MELVAQQFNIVDLTLVGEILPVGEDMWINNPIGINLKKFKHGNATTE